MEPGGSSESSPQQQKQLQPAFQTNGSDERLLLAFPGNHHLFLHLTQAVIPRFSTLLLLDGFE